jgi:type IV secretory pathway TraG/TraD family ATPase VirD4
VFGPNGSGKTTSLIVPNVLDWDGPVVLTTSKPQDLEPLCTARRQRGPVWIVAPGGAPGHECCGWSPIDGATDPESADRLAEWLVDSSGMAADPKSRPWNAQARKYLKGLLLATHLHGGGIVQWTRWIHAGERVRDTVEDVLRGAGHDEVAQEYASTWSLHEEGKGSVLFTALGLADTYSRPGVLRAAERAGFDPGDFLDRSGTLCIVTPNAEGERFAPYFTALLSALIREAETRAAESRGPLEPRLLLALDEAGNVFRYPRLPHLLTTARGNGIQLLLIYHDLAQVEHLYGGREVARTVISNAKMRMLLPGVGDLDTLRYWSDLMGQTQRMSHGTTSGADGRRSRSQNEHTDHLAPLHRLQQLSDGEAVLLYQNLPPARVRLLPWYADRRFRDLAH